ncbi:Hsp20/alpha crystallin family protein [Exilibacterium tricleocarpae]|uniref:Hsp20/alpha crystallin family protein n=1 Tax=Exilibacterium tricleocarpae TaxID=2591008 RepID=A0A545U9U9_9GAMM|nr:Hsp20/alpha crystallin family protein [Exilibacterium tricleocarpae]TQV86257.1 Hsp20/alpha crystallin family protein [Exilibacterium tricleocarpae]
MDLQKLNPWNWFKHEESPAADAGRVPVKRAAGEVGPAGAGHDHPVMQLHRQMDRLFDEVFRGFGFPSAGSRSGEPAGWAGQGVFRPSLDVASDEKSYHVTLEAPGMTESDLSIEVRGDVLTIQGQKQEENESKDKHFYRIERSYGAFRRTLSLPEDANADGIEAAMKNGVLSLVIPRREVIDSEVKKISINP